jgi:hypothetical protein
MLQNVKKALANPEPSTHDAKATLDGCRTLLAAGSGFRTLMTNPASCLGGTFLTERSRCGLI